MAKGSMSKGPSHKIRQSSCKPLGEYPWTLLVFIFQADIGENDNGDFPVFGDCLGPRFGSVLPVSETGKSDNYVKINEKMTVIYGKSI